MPKKLAVTIAGAVSLGSYEAGVLYEVLDAIHSYNTDPGVEADDRIVIDVLTGASAGGMTAIILAQKLLYNADEFRGPYDNPLYNTWVKTIDLQGLQTVGEEELALHSIFSSDLIETISRQTLTQRYTSDPLPAQVPHAAVMDTPSIRVGVAMTNLNGVAYGYEVLPKGSFNYIDYSDQLTREILKGDAACDNADFWEPLRGAAVACGAFPLAFRPRELDRYAAQETDDYPAEQPDGNRLPWPHEQIRFTYSDGGILQNQPLGMAKNLVDLTDYHENQDRRYYLFVSPNAKDSQANDSFHAGAADYFHLVARLLSVVIGQAGFHDWITAKNMNTRVKLLDERARGLMYAMLGGEIDITCLNTTAESLLNLFFCCPPGSDPCPRLNRVHTSPGATGPEKLGDAQTRISHQYSDEINTINHKFPAAPGTPGASDAFRDAVLAFETAAGLGARDHMTIYGVTATSSELAGAGLQAFLGFFTQDYRDHDYDVGRSHARDALRSPVLAQAPTPEHVAGIWYRQGMPVQADGYIYPGKPIRPINTGLSGISLGQVPPKVIHAFRTHLRTRLNQMLHELWPHWSWTAVPGADVILHQLLDGLIDKAQSS
jgi:predicted acylesterase/phospholipase RssA